MTRKRAKKLMMRYGLDRNTAQLALTSKNPGCTNEQCVEAVRDCFISAWVNTIKRSGMLYDFFALFTGKDLGDAEPAIRQAVADLIERGTI